MSIIEQTVAQALTQVKSDVSDLKTLSANLNARTAALEGGVVPLAVISLLVASASIVEGSGGGTKTVTTTVKRTLTSGVLAVPIDYVLGTMDAADHGGSLPGTKVAIFADGSDTATITDTIASDDTVEPNETFGRAVRAGGIEYTVGSPAAVTYTVTNDDVAAFPALVIAGSRTATTAAGQGYEVGRIYGAPDGVVPTIAPNDGRFVLGAKVSDYYPVVRGATAVTAGVLSYTASAAGATDVSFTIAVTDANQVFRGGYMSTNMDGTSLFYSGGFSPFLNLTKTIDTWSSNAVLDANGYPTAGSETVAAGFGINKYPGAPVTRHEYRWSGTGSVILFCNQGGSINVVSSAPGLIVYDHTFAPGADWSAVQVHLTNGSITDQSDYITAVEGRTGFVSHKTLAGQGLIFNPEILPGYRDKTTARLMDWLRINYDVAAANGIWANRAKITDCAWNRNGIPIEIAVMFCNLIGANLWYNFKTTATDDYVRQACRYIKANLNPWLYCIYEYSNEVWNFDFSQAAWVADYARTYNPAFGHWEGIGIRGSQIAKIVNEEYADAPKRKFNAVNTQTYYYDVIDGIRTGAEFIGNGLNTFDQLALTFYLDGGLQGQPKQNGAYPASNATILAKAKANDLDWAFAQLRGTSNDLPGANTLAGLQSVFSRFVSVAQQYGLDLVCYEGGTHFNVLNRMAEDGTADQEAVLQYFENMHQDDRMRLLFLDTHTYLRSIRVKEQCNFSDVGYHNKFGYWGVRDTYLSAPSPRAQAMEQFQASPSPAQFPSPPDLVIQPFDLPTRIVVGKAITPIPVIVTGGKKPYNIQVTGLPAGWTYNGSAISGAATNPDEQFTIVVSVGDSQDTPDTATLSRSGTISGPTTLQYASVDVLTMILGNGGPVQNCNMEEITFAKNGVALPTIVYATNSTNDPTGAPVSNLTDGDLTTRSQSEGSPPDGVWAVGLKLVNGADTPDQIWIAAEKHDQFRSPRKIRIRKMPSQAADVAVLTNGTALFTYDLFGDFANPYVAGQFAKFDLPAY